MLSSCIRRPLSACLRYLRVMPRHDFEASASSVRAEALFQCFKVSTLAASLVSKLQSFNRVPAGSLVSKLRSLQGVPAGSRKESSGARLHLKSRNRPGLSIDPLLFPVLPSSLGTDHYGSLPPPGLVLLSGLEQDLAYSPCHLSLTYRVSSSDTSWPRKLRASWLV